MTSFRAKATNKDGDTFVVRFHNPNWNGALEAAVCAMNQIVNNDSTHMRHGPWVIDPHTIDIGF